MAYRPETVPTGPQEARVHILALGRFQVQVAGTPLDMRAKGHTKPLELLKLLVALGGQGIASERLAEALWPNAEGDAERGALTTTLYRLRKLIGADALSLADARLTLERGLCWVDAWEFADALKAAALAAGAKNVEPAWSGVERALELYRGPYLDGEFDLPDVMAAREKLHGMFLRHVEELGAFFSAAGERQRAIKLYQQGLECDDLAEDFYRHLMECYRQEGRLGDAVSLYQRCREALKHGAGIEPAPETTALYRLLVTGAEPRKAPSVATERAEVAQQIMESDRPSDDRIRIAVLPFVNLSEDSSQAFFADGLVEEILTSLSKISSMTVIARNSTFTYKGKAVDVRDVARDLGVRYVMEGSVRPGGNRLRISAQLVDSTDGGHLWAEHYDRVVEDIFDIQDEITKEIVTALRVKLRNSEDALLLNRGTKNVEAWGICVQALEHWHTWNPADHVRARELAARAANLDPDYALAWAIMGFTYWYGARAAFDDDAQASLARAAELAAEALALDETNPWALGLSMLVQISLGDIDQSLAMGRRLISLYPGSADSRARYAFALLSGGRPHEAVLMVKDAMRLNPLQPFRYQGTLARALDVGGQTEESLKVADAILARQPKMFPVVLLRTGILAREGREQEAKEAMADLRRISPNFRLSHVKGHFMLQDEGYVATITEALRMAGLPE